MTVPIDTELTSAAHQQGVFTIRAVLDIGLAIFFTEKQRLFIFRFGRIIGVAATVFTVVESFPFD